jgi:hypothetical protein
MAQECRVVFKEMFCRLCHCLFFACVGRNWSCQHHAEQRQQREESTENRGVPDHHLLRGKKGVVAKLHFKYFAK